MEAARFDAYDAKTLMQWTLYGFPMYAIRTGIAADPEGVLRRPLAGPAPKADELPVVERRDGVTLEQRLSAGPFAEGPSELSLPRFLTRVETRLDFTAEDVYAKFDARGEPVSEPGCPTDAGCYYRLNGLATGAADLPIQPFFVFDSRLSGTRQHGILWKGGRWTEEDEWIPVFAELVSNGGDGSNHGSTPRQVFVRPRRPRRRALGDEGPLCRPNDAEVNSVVLTTGEVLKANEDDTEFSILRLHRQVDLEVFFFNNTVTGEGNCDDAGPVFGVGPYHEVRGTSVEWAVPVSDEGEVWRVVAVYSDGTLDAGGEGRWTPVELSDDGTGRFRGRLSVGSSKRLTYYLQAVDYRGNVSWVEYKGAETPASGVEPGIPRPIDVTF
jgi:hypothetical protein